MSQPLVTFYCRGCSKPLNDYPPNIDKVLEAPFIHLLSEAMCEKCKAEERQALLEQGHRGENIVLLSDVLIKGFGIDDARIFGLDNSQTEELNLSLKSWQNNFTGEEISSIDDNRISKEFKRLLKKVIIHYPKIK